MTKRSSLSRRTLLRGAGVALGLPLLEQMLPSVASAQAGTAPRRFIAFYTPCGINMAKWNLATTGTLGTLSPTLASLAGVKQKLTVISGLANRPAIPDGNGGHATGTGAFLTATRPLKTLGTNIRNGVSIDQVMAQALRGQTRFPSLELGTDRPYGGGGEQGYSHVYMSNISWASPTTPLAKETDPRALFDRVFAGVGTSPTDPSIARRRAYRLSVLDLAKDDATRLRGRLGQADQRKLDEYLTAVREVEARVEAVPTPVAQCTPGMKPTVPADLQAQLRALIDVVVLAFQCDLTRVATLMLGNALSGRVYAGESTGHHLLSHHQNDAAKLDALGRIDAFEVSQYAYLLQRLEAVSDGAGTLLDSSLAYFSSEIADGNSHQHVNMPVLLGGGGGGAVTPGRHLKLSEEQPLANLFISCAQAMGAPITSFGEDGVAPLAGLKV